MLDIKLTLANILTKLKSHDTSLSKLDTARGGPVKVAERKQKHP